MSHPQSSYVYDCFEFDDKNKIYKCIEKKKNSKKKPGISHFKW